ncbi:MAG TPA: ClpXP protease specificity-enhancing factor SspB [Polyangiaceae bacterium]|nr:ClpXP protease specificity-enhancing factor SspB [Polyangiaceae bacterium]
MTAPTALPPKKDVMLALLQRSSVFINLDPRGEDVRVPPWFKKQPQLVLQVGLNMAVRIPDLDVGDEAVSCTLSFNRSPFFCWIPWRAVFALVGDDGKGMMWPSDIPKEVAAAQAERAQKEQARPELRSIGPAPAAPAPAAASATQKKAEPGKRSRKRSPARVQAEAGAEAPRADVAAPAEAAAPGTPARPGPSRDGASTQEKQGEKRKLPSYLRVVK